MNWHKADYIGVILPYLKLRSVTLQNVK